MAEFKIQTFYFMTSYTKLTSHLLKLLIYQHHIINIYIKFFVTLFEDQKKALKYDLNLNELKTQHC